MATPKNKMPVGIAMNTDCSWCHTSLNENKFCFLWTIEKFSCLQKATGEYIESATFSSRDDDRNTFCMWLYPKGDKEDTKDYVSLFLIHPRGDFPIDVDYEFCFVNNKKELSSKQATAASRTFEKINSGWGRSKFVRLDYLTSEENGLMQNDEVTIFCEVLLKVKKHTNKNGSFNLSSDKDSKCCQTEDLGSFHKESKCCQTEDLGSHETRNFSDVVLVAKDGKGEVHAHKAILMLKSPVFAAMFEHNMEESQKNRIEIVDIDHAVLQEMVQFIYTGKTPAVDDEMATRLLAAAEKYALEELKFSCEQSLSMNLTHEKVANLIPLASLYGASHLIARLIDYLKLNAMDDAIDHLWDNLISQHPNQAVDICCKTLATKQVGF